MSTTSSAQNFKKNKIDSLPQRQTHYFLKKYLSEIQVMTYLFEERKSGIFEALY